MSCSKVSGLRPSNSCGSRDGAHASENTPSPEPASHQAQHHGELSKEFGDDAIAIGQAIGNLKQAADARPPDADRIQTTIDGLVDAIQRSKASGGTGQEWRQKLSPILASTGVDPATAERVVNAMPDTSTLAMHAPTGHRLGTNFDGWNLQLPTGRPGHPDTLRGAAIGKADQFGVRQVPGGIELTANAGGVTTGGSHHARAEFGESKGKNGAAGWNNSDGRTHQLDLITTLTRLPNRKPKVTIMQIKDQGGNAANLGIEVIPRTKNGSLKDGLVLAARVYGGAKPQIIGPYKLGDPIHLVVTTKDRHLTIDYNGNKVIDTPYRIDHASFKAGVYAQFNRSDGFAPGVSATAIISKLQVHH
jgi:hypothetical protein